MKTYEITCYEDGVTDLTEAEDIAAACAHAENWARDGDWGEEGTVVRCSVTEIMPLKLTYRLGEAVVGVHTCGGLDTLEERSKWDARMMDDDASHPAPDGWTGEWAEAMWDAFSFSSDVADVEDIQVEIEPDHATLMQAAGASEDCEHKWSTEGEGGLKENPGVWSTGGTGLIFESHCTRCGLRRKERSPGIQNNHDEHDTVEYRMPDEDELRDMIECGMVEEQTQD